MLPVFSEIAYIIIFALSVSRAHRRCVCRLLCVLFCCDKLEKDL